MADKQYYMDIFNKKWDACLEEAEIDIKENGGNVDISDVATEIFEETANSEEVVGFYIIYHGDEALRDWERNTDGIVFSDKDKEVDRILRELYQ